MWYNEQGPGCNQCDYGYLAIKSDINFFNPNSCVFSNFVQANLTNFPLQKTGSDTSNFINNCESYVVDNSKVICNKCNTNYALRFDGTECITLSNCLSAHNIRNICLKCKIGFGLVQNLCFAGTILHCSTYNREFSNTTKVICTKCNEGFFKTNDNLCAKGNVANCLTYKDGSANDCEICKFGYFRIEKNKLSTSAHDYCYKMNETLNCLTASILSSDIGARLTCIQCSQLYAIKEEPKENENQTSCLTFNSIDNCETYNNNSTLATSTLLCSSCIFGFYLNKNGSECVKRTVTPIDCQIYEKSQNLCSTCNDGYFLSADGKECIIFPQGVKGCIEYLNSDTCTLCGSENFLNKGVCTDIATNDKITHCLYYSDLNTCLTCNNDYILEEGICVRINVTNCLKVANKNECESCLPGFRLILEHGITNCKSLNKPDCVTFNQRGSNACLQCKKNFYINVDGDCVSVPVLNIIENCLVNETIDTCKSCSNRTALSFDKKSCEDASVFDSNCETIVLSEKMNCSRCNPGYFFKDGICTPFIGRSISNGCFSQDINDESICLLCNTGFYMTRFLNCVENGIKFGNKREILRLENINIIRSLISILVTLVLLF